MNDVLDLIKLCDGFLELNIISDNSFLPFTISDEEKNYEMSGRSLHQDPSPGRGQNRGPGVNIIKHFFPSLTQKNASVFWYFFRLF
jgi:hypothetical protein